MGCNGNLFKYMITTITKTLHEYDEVLRSSKSDELSLKHLTFGCFKKTDARLSVCILGRK